MNITKQQALNILLGLLIVIIVFHLSIITQVVPYNIVWAGKLNSLNEMYAFEAISIAINVLLIGLLILKQHHLKKGVSNKVLTITLWLFVVLFALNTIGNLFAKTWFEKLVFTPITFLLAVLIWISVRNDRK